MRNIRPVPAPAARAHTARFDSSWCATSRGARSPERSGCSTLARWETCFVVDAIGTLLDIVSELAEQTGILPSTPPLKRQDPERPAGDLPSWPMKSASSRSASECILAVDDRPTYLQTLGDGLEADGSDERSG